jgi:prevent-host-death family protein
MRWQMQTAKQKLSEVVDAAMREGPQFITRHGKDVAVVVSIDEYRKLRGEDDFKAFLLSGPSLDDLDLTRSQDPPRDVDFGV